MKPGQLAWQGIGGGICPWGAARLKIRAKLVHAMRRAAEVQAGASGQAFYGPVSLLKRMPLDHPPVPPTLVPKATGWPRGGTSVEGSTWAANQYIPQWT